MRSSWLAAAIVASSLLGAQPGRLDPQRSLKIDFPADSPIALLSYDGGESTAAARGGALVLDLHTSLTLRNSGQRRIRGVTLLVLAQEVTPGGKASVTVPSLDIGPGESFPLRIDLRLLRPLQSAAGYVQVGLDGVLFSDLSFYGPDHLQSRRIMTVCEMEARRDRQYFKTLLDRGGPDGLQREMIALQGQAPRPSLDVQMVRGGRSTNVDAEKEVQFVFLHLPDSPVEALDGRAMVFGNEARAPRVEVRNRSDRAVRWVEIGWIVQDRAGHEFLAGSLPADTHLSPGQRSQITKDTTLKFPQRPGQAAPLDQMTGFINTVEYADGTVWVPSRSDLRDPHLLRTLGPSSEEERLQQIYRKKGLKALVEELKRY